MKHDSKKKCPGCIWCSAARLIDDAGKEGDLTKVMELQAEVDATSAVTALINTPLALSAEAFDRAISLANRTGDQRMLKIFTAFKEACHTVHDK